MKKLLLALLACAMLLSFAACNEEAPSVQQSAEPKNTFDASKTYNDALKKTTELSSYDSVMELNVTYNDDSVISGINSVMTCTLDQTDAADPMLYYSVDSYDIELDNHYVNTIYYDDGWMYMSTAGGDKFKQEVPGEDVVNEYSEVPQLLLPDDAFKSAYEAGSATEARIPTSKIQDVVDDCLSGVPQYFYSVDDDNEFDFKYSDVTISFTVSEDGYLTQASLHFTADFEHLEGKATATVDYKISYIGPGKEVTVALPEDLDTYTLYDETEAQEQDEMTQEEIDELTGIMTEEVIAMYNFENGTATRKSNFDQLYREAVEKYGKQAVDNLVDTIEMMSGLGI